MALHSPPKYKHSCGGEDQQVAPRDRTSPATHVRRRAFIILFPDSPHVCFPLLFTLGVYVPRYTSPYQHLRLCSPRVSPKMGFLSRSSLAHSPSLGQAARIPSLRGSPLFSALSPFIAEFPNYIPLLLVVNCAGHNSFFIYMRYSNCKYLVYPEFPLPFLKAENTSFAFL